MDTIQVTLPDGATREVPKGTTPLEIARQISPRLADAAFVARVAAPNDGEGELVDLRRPLETDSKLQILTEKDPDALYVFRHSAAHLLAAAVTELFPNVKLGIGPPVDNGFFYEFLREEPFTPDDLAKIEAKMRELAAQDLPNERKLLPKPEAIELYKKSQQTFKCELVEEKAIEPMVSFYTTGKFIDFCRGPHIPSTKRKIQAFKLDERCRRLLEGAGRQSADAADLCGVLFFKKRARRIFASPGRSQAPRSSQVGRRARSLQHSRTGGARPDFLACQGRPDSQNY